MMDCFVQESNTKPCPIFVVSPQTYDSWYESQEVRVQVWLDAKGYEGKPQSFCEIPAVTGVMQSVVCSLDTPDDFYGYAALSAGLPEGVYTLKVDDAYFALAAAGFAHGCYQFNAYHKNAPKNVRLHLALASQAAFLNHLASSQYFMRDLVNTPTEDMGPAELAEAAEHLAKENKAKVNVIVGNDLLKKNYPAIHAFGRASVNAPRLIDLTWGDKNAKKITLVGKGVCFDSGGLDLKSAVGMLTMKKDMGGAACALGLARLIMLENLPVRLRVIIGAIENSVSGDSIRPGDVVHTRNGKTVEILNTDAEGRMVLCDALTEAASEQPDYLFDFATLTGAARVALGPDIPALMSNNKALEVALMSASEKINDPLWSLPLYAPYEKLLKSEIADTANCSRGGHGGAITAGLYLQGFVPKNIPWVHVDMFAWNAASQPGRMMGADTQGFRAVYECIKGLIKE